MDKLTDEQIEFLDAEGKVVVKACPGSGKTYSVANKLLKYLNNWEDDHQGIAVLSFTNVASDEINKKTIALNDNKAKLGYPHYIGTVDSFLNEFIVLRYGYLKTHDHSRPIIALRDNWKMQFKWWRTKCYSDGCVKNIDSFHLGLNNQLYKGKNAVTCEPSRPGLLLPCQQYRKILRQNNVFFQNDIPLFAYELLKEYPSIASAIVERFPIIIMDEVQDTSEEQMAVFDLLAEHGIRSMFLVGDSDQSIYEWRNANPECFLSKFNSDSWEHVTFNCNFRCSQNICNATTYFSSSLKGKKANVAVGAYKEEIQKPIVLQFKSYEENKVINHFLNKCKSMGIAVTPESVAVLTRARIHSDTVISDLWKTEEIELFAKAGYEWKFGSRKKAYYDMSRASFGIVIGAYTDDYQMNRKISEFTDENKWKDFVIETLLCIPDVDVGIAEWVKQAEKVYASILSKNGFRSCDGRELKEIFKIKNSNNRNSDFKAIPLKFYFEKRNSNEYTRSSIHGVKGETYDAVLLLIKSTKGRNTLTPNLLMNGDLEDELMRIAYVAMTRPRRLLMIAMPENQKLKESERFSEENWDYEYL